jgi:hypothetical protein
MRHSSHNFTVDTPKRHEDDSKELGNFGVTCEAAESGGATVPSDGCRHVERETRMTRTTRPVRAPRATKRGLASLAVSGLLAASLSALTTAPAHSAPDPSCPAVAPVSGLSAGDTVTGRTVTTGTTPGSFTGTIQGVLEDGIEPGVDMILADLHSTAIDKNGIWEGMSGSPVYAQDGRLIGAVSYGLGYGSSTITGITPAADMKKLFDPSTVVDHRVAKRVALPRALARRVVRSGGATTAQAARGLAPIGIPVSLSGPSSARVTKLAKVLRLGGKVLAAPGGPTSDDPIPMEVGGNLAAAYSYGTVTASGLGTATMVCGDETVGFGHPFDLQGAATMTLHGARAITIQDDPLNVAFKVANLGAPIGTVDQDRVAGIHGVTGALPEATQVDARSFVGDRSYSGTTRVSEPDLVTDLAATHLFTVQDKVLDRVGKGRGWASWTISGTEANGHPFSMSRSNRFADPEDISAATAIDVAGDLEAIVDNPDEIVKIGSVDVESHLADDYQRYTIAKVQVRSFGRWVTASEEGDPILVHAGHTVPVRVTLASREVPAKTIEYGVKVPAEAGGHGGLLHVLGGDDGGDSQDFFDEGEDAFSDFSVPSAANFPKLIQALESQQQRNDIRTTMRFRYASTPAAQKIVRSTKISQVVSGDRLFHVFAEN